MASGSLIGARIDDMAILPYKLRMKTTIDLPDEIVQRTKVAAALRRTTMRSLIIDGLEKVLQEEATPSPSASALARLRQGYHLGGNPLPRGEIYAGR